MTVPHNSSARRRHRSFAAIALAVFATAFSHYGYAQITSGSGNDQAESRASDSTQRANPSGNMVHESQKPQSKDAAQHPSTARAGKNKNTNGAGGFENGLYGTGAGNNSKK